MWFRLKDSKDTPLPDNGSQRVDKELVVYFSLSIKVELRYSITLDKYIRFINYI